MSTHIAHDELDWFTRSASRGIGKSSVDRKRADDTAGLIATCEAGGGDHKLQTAGSLSVRTSALDRFGFTLLHCAILAKAELKTVEELMQAFPGDVMAADKYGDTPLLKLLRPNLRKTVWSHAIKLWQHCGHVRRRGLKRYADAKHELLNSSEPPLPAAVVGVSIPASAGQRSMLSEAETEIALAVVNASAAALSITDRQGELPIALALRQHAPPALITRMALLDTGQSWPFLLQHENIMHYVNDVLETVGATDDLDSDDTDPFIVDMDQLLRVGVSVVDTAHGRGFIRAIEYDAAHGQPFVVRFDRGHEQRYDRSSALKLKLVHDSADQSRRCRRQTMLSYTPSTRGGRRINLEAIRSLATAVDRACLSPPHCSGANDIFK
jgi:hypothetical protein